MIEGTCAGKCKYFFLNTNYNFEFNFYPNIYLNGIYISCIDRMNPCNDESSIIEKIIVSEIDVAAFKQLILSSVTVDDDKAAKKLVSQVKTALYICASTLCCQHTTELNCGNISETINNCLLQHICNTQTRQERIRVFNIIYFHKNLCKDNIWNAFFLQNIKD